MPPFSSLKSSSFPFEKFDSILLLFHCCVFDFILPPSLETSTFLYTRAPISLTNKNSTRIPPIPTPYIYHLFEKWQKATIKNKHHLHISKSLHAWLLARHFNEMNAFSVLRRKRPYNSRIKCLNANLFNICFREVSAPPCAELPLSKWLHTFCLPSTWVFPSSDILLTNPRTINILNILTKSDF